VILTFRPIETWPEGWPRDPSAHSPFKASYASTLDILDRELAAIDTTEVFLQIDVKPGGVRNDGQLRADAKARNQGVILTVDAQRLGTLVYSCDQFGLDYYGNTKAGAWRQNLRAIALGMEALRKVDRYGIADRGQQYAGYKALGAGIPLGPPQMTATEALEVLRLGARWRAGPDHDDPKEIARAYKIAAKRLHPDVGGDPEEFKRLQDAVAVLNLGAGATP
jgi:hypothetical protein